MTTIFYRTLTATIVLLGLAACGHRGPRMPRFSNPFRDDDPAPAAAAESAPRPSSIVNTRQCDNQICTPLQAACEASCRRHSGWTGTVAGGPPVAPTVSASTPLPPAPKLTVGKTCSVDNECESVCVFKGNAGRGYCTKECQSFTDCPTFWRCEPVRNGSAKYCVQR